MKGSGAPTAMRNRTAGQVRAPETHNRSTGRPGFWRKRTLRRKRSVSGPALTQPEHLRVELRTRGAPEGWAKRERGAGSRPEF